MLTSADVANIMQNHPADDGKIKAALFALWGRFQKTMWARLGLIEQAGSAAMKGSLNEEQRDKAAEAAHKLAGSLGTFGLGKGSEVALELETLLEEVLPFSPDQNFRLRELTDVLRKEMERGPSPPART